MPTPISHAAVGFAIGAWTGPRGGAGAASRRVCLVAAGCAAVPDIDWPLHLADASAFSHRALTHSLLFAGAIAILATLAFFTDDRWKPHRTRIALALGLALLSHLCLDALSSYSTGVEFFAPFSDQRFRFPWTPLGDPDGNLRGQFAQEALIVLLPAVLLGWLGFRTTASRGSSYTS